MAHATNIATAKVGAASSSSWLNISVQLNKGAIFGLGIVVRLVLVAYGEWHDYHYPILPYTDIDYAVFTRGAQLVLSGQSPYDCDTYRYPPTLAVLMIPTVLLHRTIGKLIFCAADLVVAWLIWDLVADNDAMEALDARNRRGPKSTGAGRREAKKTLQMCWSAVSASLWLFNPLTIAISTRGNAEAVVATAVLATLWFLQRGRTGAAGAALGIAVHLKLYPVIYALPTLIFLGGWALPPLSLGTKGGDTLRIREMRPTWAQGRFIVGATGALGLATALSYAVYGWQFLWSTYLYHFVRADHRHNFSPYFYGVYLAASGNGDGGGGTTARVLGLAALIPQAGLVMYLGTLFAGDLRFAWLVQTMAFVMLNKVCTSQYFVWVLCLLPVAAPRIGLSLREATGLGVLWLGGQALWLQAAYRLESGGEGNYVEVWGCGLVLLGCHAWCTRRVIASYRC